MSSLLLGRLRNCRTAGVSVGVRLFSILNGVRRLFLPSRTYVICILRQGASTLRTQVMGRAKR